MEEVILVDAADRPIGFEEKLAAHRNGGRLHRAFSIFIFNRRGEMLLQRRSTRKYHFGGVWCNTCCGHPRPGELLEDSVHRRLREELGFDTELRKAFSFIYTAADAASGLTERELDHVFAGEFEGVPRPRPEEIDELRWVACDDVVRDVAVRPERYAPWLAIAIERMEASRRASNLPARPAA